MTEYPTSWDEFIGQEMARRQLLVAIEAAKARGDRLPHTLLDSGEPGIGKTALAHLTARTMGTDMQVVTGKVDTNHARILLAGMQDRDVLFVDEAHQLVVGGKASAEWLLHYLQDGYILGPRGPEPQPNVTVIAATTDAGRLPDTILSRFPLRPQLVPYTDAEGVRLAAHICARLMRDLPVPTVDCLRRIARAGSNNPRTITAIVTSLRDHATVTPTVFDPVTGYDLTEPLLWLGLSPDGLTAKSRRYLEVLLSEFQGQAGEKAMRERLQEPGGLESTERQLSSLGLLAFTKAGRTLTAAGIRRAKEEAA